MVRDEEWGGFLTFTPSFSFSFFLSLFSILFFFEG